MRATDDKETDIITSLNLCVLSKKTPITIDPKIPETMKTAPKSELSYIVQSKGFVKEFITVPTAVTVP